MLFDNKLITAMFWFIGFGNGAARRLCGEGFSVLAGCLSLDSPGAKKLRSEYPKVQLVQLDITDDTSVEKAVTDVTKTVKDTGLYFSENQITKD